MVAEGVERKIGRGAIGIDVGETTGNLALYSGRSEDRALGRRLNLVVEAFEPIPGDGGFKGIVDKTRWRQKLAGIGHANKCVPPNPRRALEMRIAGFGSLGFSAMIAAALERARHPGIKWMIAGFKPEHHDRSVAVGRAGVESLLRVEDAAVRGVEAGLRDCAHGARCFEERLKANRCTGAEFRTRLQSHPGARNDAERSFRANQHAVGAWSGT